MYGELHSISITYYRQPCIPKAYPPFLRVNAPNKYHSHETPPPPSLLMLLHRQLFLIHIRRKKNFFKIFFFFKTLGEQTLQYESQKLNLYRQGKHGSERRRRIR